MNPKLFLSGILGLALMTSSVSSANTVAGTPDAAVHYDANKVGEAIAALPMLSDAHPSTTARYYVYFCAAGWCAPCNAEMPYVAEAYKEMRKNGLVELLLVDYDYTEQDAHKFIEKYDVHFPATMSPNAVALPGIKTMNGIPYAFIVDADGNEVMSGSGSILRDWKNIISTYEQEKGLTPSFR